MPIDPPVGEMMAVLMPTTSPYMLNSGPARIAAIDGGVGLDVVVVGTGVDVAVARRHDAEGHGAAEAERVADGQRPVADADASRCRRT